MPCAGGSLWQNVNRRYASARAKTAKRRVLRRQIWSSFGVAAAHCIKQGGVVCWEWPAGCSYWKEPRVVAFMKAHNVRCVTFRGCFFG